MSMLSRGVRRSRATLAATFAFSLFTFLVVTALPASAVVASCAVNGVNAFQLDVQAGTDNTFVLAANGAAAEEYPAGAANAALTDSSYVFSINGGTFANCTGAATVAAITWVNILGAGDGIENVVLLHPNGGGIGLPIADAGEVVTVGLDNGADTLTFEFGARAFTNPADNVADGATADTMQLAVSGTTTIGDLFPCCGTADLRVDNAENLIVNGGGGSDILDAGATQSAGTLAANAGNATTTGDNIAASTGNLQQAVTFNGGADPVADTFVSGDGADTFNGGPGVDTASFIASPVGITADLAAGTATGQGNDILTDVQNVIGSNHDDTIVGSAIDNPILNGADGNDTINGGDGADGILGGTDGPDADTSGGDDLLAGDAGADTVDGEDGDDTVDEGAAANGGDVLNGGTGDEVAGDTLDHSARTAGVTVNANDGLANDGATGELDNVGCTFENYLGSSVADTYVGCNATGETFTPGAGDDSVNGGGGFDYLDLSDAAGPALFDLVAGTATGNGTDTFSLVEGFIGTAADDVLSGDSTTVLACPLGGFDFFGGDGIDLIDGSTATGAICLDLALLGTGRDVENANGGAGDDTLLGNNVANRLLGNDGFDVISGFEANDYIEGGTGNDTLAGGIGGDTLSYKGSADGMLVDAQLGFTEGIGGPGDGEDSIAGFEIFLGSAFGDDITGGQTDADANLRVKGRGGDDIITGTNSADTLTGAGGDDVIRSGGGDDTAKGGAGDDSLFGSGGNDFLTGGKGFDEAFGGPGKDVCRSTEHEVSC